MRGRYLFLFGLLTKREKKKNLAPSCEKVVCRTEVAKQMDSISLDSSEMIIAQAINGFRCN